MTQNHPERKVIFHTCNCIDEQIIQNDCYIIENYTQRGLNVVLQGNKVRILVLFLFKVAVYN